MIKTSVTTLVLLALLQLTGCDNSGWGVVRVDDNDPTMLAAIKQAKATFGFFEKNWQTMDSDGYSLKFALRTDTDGLEHIWFTPTRIRGDKITGTCANEPANIPDLKLGDTRTVSKDDVSDWMILVGNQCYGGYTIRALAELDPTAAPPLEFMDTPPTR